MKNLNKKTILLLLLIFSFIGFSFCFGGDKISLIGQKPKNVILIGWDGVGKQQLKELFDAGKLPNLQKIINEGKFIDTEVTSGTTSTKSGWAEILTGYSYRITGVYNNRTEYRPIPRGFTVFERLKEYFGKAGITTVFISGKLQNLGARGPHRVWTRGPRDIWWNEKAWEGLGVKNEEILSMQGEPYAITKDNVDFFENGLGNADNVGSKVLGYITSLKDKRFFIFSHFESPDEQGHSYGGNSKEYKAALITNDYWLGRIISELKDFKIYNETLICVTTDHGFSALGNDHQNEPHTFLIVNSPLINAGPGDRKDITPTILSRFGIDITKITPQLEGRALVSAQKEPPVSSNNMNLIMISINNIGTEHMSLYGYKRKTTPNLDKWAANALVFEDCFSPASWTLPVATSLFTSLYPYSYKIFDRYHGNLLGDGIKTLPEILNDNKYNLAAFTGGLDYDKVFGHMRGFQVIDSNPAFTGFKVTLEQAKEWLALNKDKKFFLFIHGYDAHPPFTPPEKFKGIFSKIEGRHISVDPSLTLRGYKNSNNQYVAYYHMPAVLDTIREGKDNFNEQSAQKQVLLTQDDIDYLRDLYDEEVLSVDALVGDFLNSLGKDLLGRTNIIIFSEHGEMFAKHGRFGRAGAARGTLYDDVIHVPLIIRTPEQQGRRVRGLVQIIDIMPTVLKMLNIPISPRAQGKSILPLKYGKIAVNDYVYCGAKYNTTRPIINPFYKPESVNEAVRDENWKLIHEITFSEQDNERGANAQKENFELYDIRKDPNELNDVSAAYPDKLQKLKDKLRIWADWAKAYAPDETATLSIPENLIEDARKHGYW